MTDIVEELRHWETVAHSYDAETLGKAAAEIERLRDKLVEYMNETQSKASEIERLRTDYDLLSSDYKELIGDNARLRDVLRRAGFVECDIPACNCGSWHHRYGLPERWSEIETAVAEAGFPLNNANGHLLLKAVNELIADRDQLRDDRDSWAQQADDRVKDCEGFINDLLNDAMDWNRLRAGDYRALDPDHQDVFDIVASKDVEIERLRDALGFVLEAASWHFDGEADSENESPEDMTAHINGLIVKRVREALGYES